MELKEYVKIIKKFSWTFLLVWVLVIILSLVWYKTRPATYDVSMSLEITRQASEQTADYQYDQYYRLQADEKFADTIVQWLKDPAVVNEILAKAEINFSSQTLKSLSKAFRAEKLSSNYIQLRMSTAQSSDSSKITKATQDVISEKVSLLDSESQSKTWFKVMYGKPIVALSKISLQVVLIGSIVGGFILSLMVVLCSHYWKE